mmetsp:Transcript_20182/g.30349  ORF Transcript_20182/g.30349 Transcript_20182/m.30349 type:complete len:276 (-) Transcript_20182:134-961(-)|eukprot:CAMPEP_0178919300 /NCGR_PEP_ID=MMETSP0786-20121207/14356_1 /TAXON_ID=186022 /ORGANISM="Thalassionema frauenfeldii, Strain CCMP 1798" /LENGTH=275 /DNA_ID=CAMNT_0020593207 /DNA_START=155 /DNA_END=982 /DNA_ORIENTATION=-
MTASSLDSSDWEVVEKTNDHEIENHDVDVNADDSHKDTSNDVKDSRKNVIIEPSTLSKISSNEGKKDESSVIKKTATAVAGGAMVGVGLIMIPLPTPFGAVVAGGGMAVLGTEFPAAQRALDKTCNAVADVIEKSVSKDDDDDLDCRDMKPVEKNNGCTEYANEKMKKLLDEKHHSRSSEVSFNIKKSMKQLGKKVVPVIRRIGEGIDKDSINEATESISKATTDTRETVSSLAKSTHSKVSKGASQLWRTVMVLDDDEDLLAPFKKTSNVTDRK